MKLQETVTGEPKEIDLGYPATAYPYFNGSSDQIDIPYCEDLNPTSFTVEMWVQFHGGRGYRAILTNVSGSGGIGRRGYVFCINAAQYWQFWIGSGYKGIPWIIITGSKVKEGIWTHIAGTYDSLSQTMILYVNGQSVGRYEETVFQPNDRHPLHVGAGATEQAGASSCFFHGSITKVRIWERSLSLAEIQNAAERSPDSLETPSMTLSPEIAQLQLPTTPTPQVDSIPSTESPSPTDFLTPQIPQLQLPTTPTSQVHSIPFTESPLPTDFLTPQIPQLQLPTTPTSQVHSIPFTESPLPTDFLTPQIPQLQLPTTPTPQVHSTPSTESPLPTDLLTPQIDISLPAQQLNLNQPNPSVLPIISSQVKQTGEKSTSQVTASQSNQLNEERSKTADDQKNANQGDIHGVTRAHTEAPSKSLHPVLMFNGKDDYIEIPYSSTFDFAQDQDFAIEVWLQPDSVQQGEGKPTFDINVLEKWIGTPFPYAIRYSSKNGRVYVSRYDGKKNPAVYSTQPINDLQLHYIAFVKQSSQLYLYVDGVEVASTNDTTIQTTQNNSSLYLCRGAGRRNFFKGQIAEFRIWNRSRSPIEIKADMSRRLVGNELGLVGYWPLNEGTGCIVNDKTNNANHGKIHEATWVTN
ncbi:MAG: hypothetical protein PUP93_24895 [Rhizonema sp. NSF051]|nr:hypothetical protein [Rhizonema sp. NSF051]